MHTHFQPFKATSLAHKKTRKTNEQKRLLPEKVRHDIAFTVHIPTHETKPEIQSVEQLCSLIKFQRATIVTNTECLGLKAPTMTRSPMQIIQKTRLLSLRFHKTKHGRFPQAHPERCESPFSNLSPTFLTWQSRYCHRRPYP